MGDIKTPPLDFRMETLATASSCGGCAPAPPRVQFLARACAERLTRRRSFCLARALFSMGDIETPPLDGGTLRNNTCRKHLRERQGCWKKNLARVAFRRCCACFFSLESFRPPSAKKAVADLRRGRFGRFPVARSRRTIFAKRPPSQRRD